MACVRTQLTHVIAANPMGASSPMPGPGAAGDALRARAEPQREIDTHYLIIQPIIIK